MIIFEEILLEYYRPQAIIYFSLLFVLFHEVSNKLFYTNDAENSHKIVLALEPYVPKKRYKFYTYVRNRSKQIQKRFTKMTCWNKPYVKY